MANVISDETIEYVGILAKLALSDEEKDRKKPKAAVVSGSNTTPMDAKPSRKASSGYRPYSSKAAHRLPGVKLPSSKDR